MSSQVIKTRNLKTELRRLYQPPANDVTLVEVPEMTFLMIDGAGNPNTARDYRQPYTAS